MICYYLPHQPVDSWRIKNPFWAVKRSDVLRLLDGEPTAVLSLSALSGCNENDTDHLDRDQQAYPPTQKTKRMRTSFKHHQLRTMKSYFAINHNPDAKDLKQLAQKTGLTKRVLQVSREPFF